jgi:hypothetical protein
LAATKKRWGNGQGAQIFQKSMGNLKIPGARQMTTGKIYTEEAQIFGATIQNFVARGNKEPRISKTLG